MNMDNDRAIPGYCEMQARSRSSIFEQFVDDEGLSLTASLDVAINILDRTRSEDDVARTIYNQRKM